MKKRGFESREKKSKLYLVRKDAVILSVTFLVFILAMFNLASLTGRQVVNTAHPLGDANLDGKVSSTDSSFIVEYVEGVRQFTPEQITLSDVNNDDKVTMEDAENVALYVARRIRYLPVPPPNPRSKPYVPSRFKAAAAAYTPDVILTWIDNADNEEGFRIYRNTIGIGANSSILIANLSPNTLTYIDNETDENTNYVYRIESYNHFGNSIRGPMEYVKTNNLAINPPEKIQATTLSPSEIEISWEDVNSEEGYRLERRKEGTTFWAEIANLQANTISYTDQVVESVPYCYRIKSYAQIRISQPSIETCSAPCTDECVFDEQKCSATTTYQTCGNHDRDTCLEWGTPKNCASEQKCESGICINNIIEICDNGIDDDKDSFKDNLDSDCSEHPLHKPFLTANLAKDYYLPGQTIDGNITITFSGSIKPDSELTATLREDEGKIKAIDYLEENGINYSISEEKIQLNNPQPIKTINLDPGKESFIGFRLPKLATVDNIIMKIRGDLTRPPRGLSLDIPDETNKPEWKYLGNSMNTYGIATTSETLELASEGNTQYLDSDSTYYCQEINLSYSKDFLVSAKYASPKNTNANLDAAILSFDGATAYGGGDRCRLPKGNTTSMWHSCNINLQQGISGHHLICLKTDVTERSYEISRDNSQTDSRYNCDIQEEGEYSYAYCTPLTSKNYFIKISSGLYNNYLNESIESEQFNKWTTDNSFTESLTSHLSSCEEDSLGDCYTIMKIKSENGGRVTLSDLRLDYTEYGGGSSYANKFYDASVLKPEIYKINNNNITNLTTNIPLALFNITAPNVTKKENLSLHLEFAGDETSVGVLIHPLSSQDTSAPEQVVTDFESKMNKIKTHEIGWALNLDKNLGLLTGYKEDIAKIKNSNMPPDMKEDALEGIKNKMLNSIGGIPETVESFGTVKESVVINSPDLKEALGESSPQILNFQDQVNVQVEVKNYEVINYDGSTNVYSIVNKIIKVDKELKEVYVYEIIPKDIARSVSDVIFKNPGFEIEKEDPIVKYYYPSLNSATITYAVKSTVMQNNIYGFKSVVFPREIPEEPEEQLTSETPSSCGDEICNIPEEDYEICPEDCELQRKIPLLWIIILVVVLAGGVLYFNFYKGRLSMNKLTRKNMPFGSEQDLESVKNYINLQTKKKVKKNAISKSLLDKGWTEDQIGYAFEDINWDRKRDILISNTPSVNDNMKKLEMYITKCKQLNISEQKITANLKSKGWCDADIEEALSKYNPGVSSEKKETKLFFEK